MYANELLKGVPLMQGDFTIEEGDRVIGAAEVRKMLTDCIIQGQVMTMVMGLVHEGDGWDGPKYVEEHVYAMEFMVGAQLVDELTAWDGRLAFRLLSLPLPGDGQRESEEQLQAKGIVEGCWQRSFGFKLAHGMILKVFGETLGSLWRKNEGMDCVPGTYADWLRYGMVYWNQAGIPRRVEYRAVEPIKRGPLLKAD